MSKKKSAQTFKDRLRFLIGDEKPYAWCKKVGIEKGLFQYYWQKDKIPKNENLLRIRDYTKCSLDWLLTGEGEPYSDRLSDIAAATDGLLLEINGQIAALGRHIAQLEALKKQTIKLRK